MSRAPDEAEIDESSGYLEAFERVFRLHERGKSFSGREPNCAFINTGGAFADISASSGLNFPDDARGVATVDWDQDGDLDLWFANRTAPQLRFMRNETPRRSRSLRLRLEGTESNRDAIGARVELLLRTAEGELVTLVRTVRAGEGFLSQSSKWLHFGLGDDATIAAVKVRWPRGRTESFDGLEPGHHYRLVEGSGAAVIWKPPSRTLALEKDAVAVPQPETPPRVVFAARAPLPELSYETFEGEEKQLLRLDDSPILINLWATWCLPCATELRDLTESADELALANLTVLALSVDGLDPEQMTTAADAEHFLSDLGFPHTAGMAGETLLSKLQILHDNLFSTHVEFAIPTSFLVDDQGRLAALYRGPIDVERLVEDARNLAAPAALRRKLAVPLAGRWLAPVQELRLTSFAQRFAEEGFPGEAERYLRMELDRRPDDPNLRQSLARQLVSDDRRDEAISVLRAGAAGEARLSQPLSLLLVAEGTAALENGELEQAARHFAESLELVPGQLDALSNLGITRLQQGRLDDAERLLRRAVEVDDSSPGAHNNLGIVLARRGALDEAITAFERALALDPGFTDARTNLEAVREAAAR